MSLSPKLDRISMSQASPMPEGLGDELLRQFLGYNMKTAFLPVRDDMGRVLEPLGLRVMSFSALAVVIENPDISQSQLSQVLRIERSGMVVLIDDLENRDLISRNRVEGDRRAYALRATLEGQMLWEQAEAAVRAHEDRMFADLSAEDRAQLHGLLRRLGERR